MEKHSTYFYIKSIYTGQVHLVTQPPKFNGWITSNEKEFNDYYLSKGINPNEIKKSML